MGFSCPFGVRRKTTKPKAPLRSGAFSLALNTGLQAE
jgi:hypothetical protein